MDKSVQMLEGKDYHNSKQFHEWNRIIIEDNERITKAMQDARE